MTLPLLWALLSAAPAPAPPPPPRPLLLTALQAHGDVDGDDVRDLQQHLLEALQRDPQLSVRVNQRSCPDEATALTLAPAHGYVVYGAVSWSGPLLVVDLHLFDADRGSAAMRARLEAPDVRTLRGQIDETAIRMLGGEPSSSLSPWIIVGGVTAGVGVVALVVGGIGFLHAQDTLSRDAADPAALALRGPALVTAIGGGALLVGGVVVVGLLAAE